MGKTELVAPVEEYNLQSVYNFTYAVGTPTYMAPEQLYGIGDNRSDLFALGITAYECLTGKKARRLSGRPSDLRDLIDILSFVESPNQHRQEISGELNEILTHLLSPYAPDRYQTANDFLEDLNAFKYDSKQPIGSTVGTAFVAISYSDDFLDTFKIISNATKGARLKARRLDQHVFFKDIWMQCLQEIEAAKVVIADFTSIPPTEFPNPNVVTEAAHPRAIGKPLILIKQGRVDDVPFDWRYIPIISYEKSEQGLLALESRLIEKLRKLT